MASGCRQVDRRRMALALPAAWLAPAPAHASDAPSDGRLSLAVAQRARAFLAAAPQVPGVAVGVLQGDRVHAAGYGRRRWDGPGAPTSRTVYPIASITKTFTATLLAQAVVERRVTLDDDVRTHLDGAYPNLAFGDRPIRLWHLVNHNSGLPFNLPDVPETRPPFPPASPSVRRRLDAYGRADFYADLRRVELSGPPGEGFSYSNAGAILLSYVLEAVYGAPYDALVSRYVTGPLGMTATALAPAPQQATRLAPGYDEQRRRAPPPRAAALGAGALTSTVADLLRYARWQMAETDPAVRLTHAPHTIDGRFSVGLNWQIVSDGALRRIWQDGTIPGYAAMCAMLPHDRIALVAFANELDRTSNQAFHRMTAAILTDLSPASADLFAEG